MKRIFNMMALLLCLMATAGMIGCSKDNNGTSGAAAKLYGTWQKYDTYFAQYNDGWSDKLTLKSDGTYTFEEWGDAWGNHIEYHSGSWSYNEYTKRLEWYYYSEFVYAISSSEMTLLSNDGEFTRWRKL